jgi:uncharacterized protein YeaO (DUF488 family)
MIRIKRIYDRASPGDGRRIYVDRLWPRGMRKDEAKMDAWLKEIAPSGELRKWFGHDPGKYEEFKRRYLEELKPHAELLDRLRREARTETVTLLFSARDGEHNNAAVLRELLAR